MYIVFFIIGPLVSESLYHFRSPAASFKGWINSQKEGFKFPPHYAALNQYGHVLASGTWASSQ